MEELINWFYDEKCTNIELNIQPDEIQFNFEELGNLKLHFNFPIGDINVLAIRYNFNDFILHKLISTYLTAALNPTTTPGKNWSGWQTNNINGWQIIDTPGIIPIKNIISTLGNTDKPDKPDKPDNTNTTDKPDTTNTTDKPDEPDTTNTTDNISKTNKTNKINKINNTTIADKSVIISKLGRLIAKVYPSEYWPLIWQADSTLHIVSKTFTYNYDTFRLITLLLKNVIKADLLQNGRANKIYKPLPPYIKNINRDNIYLENDTIYTIADITTALNNIIDKLEKARVIIGDFMANIDHTLMPHELELYTSNWLAYEMLLCAIQNFTQFKLENYSSPNLKLRDHIRIFRVQYNDLSLASRFDKLMTRSNTTLYHGSGLPNWYSIFYNGLYDGTTSKILLNGAAHGIGIYLSNYFSMSYGYSCAHLTPNTPVLVGVFQLDTTDINNYKKTTSIYVVDKPEILALRYLIWIEPLPNLTKNTTLAYENYKISCDEFKILDKYFISDGAATQACTETLLKSQKGITRKYKEMQKMTEQQNTPDSGLDYNFNIPDEDNYNIWQVLISKNNFFDTDPTITFAKQTLLYQDMHTFNIKHIVFEITLPDDYPHSPPFIRIITPRFVHLTGHITIGGSICSELLMKQNWVPTLSILKVMIIICHNMIDGGARLSRGSELLRPYTFAEAESAYNRMVKTHGAEWSISKK